MHAAVSPDGDIRVNAVSAPVRRASVDALRGITVAAMLLVNNPGDWGHVYAPLLHAQWHGLTPTDLIFPLFLFVVGVSIALALMPRLERGESRSALANTVVARAARIFGLGLLLHLCALWAFDLPHYRVMGVLQRIGLCFAAAGPLALYARPRLQWAILATLLVGYAVLLATGGSHAPFDNIASRLDHALLGVHVYQVDPASGGGHDPEGVVARLVHWPRPCSAYAPAPGCAPAGCRGCGRRGPSPWSPGRSGHRRCRSTRTCGPRRTCCGPAASPVGFWCCATG